MSNSAFLNELLAALGYSDSQHFIKSDGEVELSIAHLTRDARKANVTGIYLVRTATDAAQQSRKRPAVYVAVADSIEKAHLIHRHLWNQGSTPVILVSLPGQVRIYSGFKFDYANESVGRIGKAMPESMGLAQIADALSFMNAESIDRGTIWQASDLKTSKEDKVDYLLLEALKTLADVLVTRYSVKHYVAHSLIGRFVYLYYLRERKILSDEWLLDRGVRPSNVFSRECRLSSFRRLADAVDERFNGEIFPIDWNGKDAPTEEVVNVVARAFQGDNVHSGQRALFQQFDFSFIPIELLSAIYEQFLHVEERGDDDSAFYTPEPAADYLLAEVASELRFTEDMKILDPCCGSGIFLVLAYRRLVELKLQNANSKKLRLTELRSILTNSIFGVERNHEACLVTEFSLILAMLSYIDPPELHAHTSFKFPSLRNNQIFNGDFFGSDASDWRRGREFDCIVGNPPWREVNINDEDEVAREQPILEWLQRESITRKRAVARRRTSEAFAWIVGDCLSVNGIAGLLIQATSLTNDQSGDFRRTFFSEVDVRRVTNFANAAYVLFESAEEPAATIVFSRKCNGEPRDIVHFGPLLANQISMVQSQRKEKRPAPWMISVCESEIQAVEPAEARKGLATTWKRALWGNSRDRRALSKLQRMFPDSLGELADKRGWSLCLGIQLRGDEGSEDDSNTYFSELEGQEVLRTPLRGVRARLEVPAEWVKPNEIGCYIRDRGGPNGVKLIAAPHILLWNDFGAFSDTPCIFLHPKVGLSGPQEDENWLRAIAVIWSSSVTRYVLFLSLSSSWGISRSTIDLDDARQMPMPKLSNEQIRRLSRFQVKHSSQSARRLSLEDWQHQLDAEITECLAVPSEVMLLARELAEYRLPLIKGKTPWKLVTRPKDDQLLKYATRLTSELDKFLEKKKHRHQVVISTSESGTIATISLVERHQDRTPSVKSATAETSNAVQKILRLAEVRYGQWIYVRRSVVIFLSNQVHLCKPSRVLEWTETRAMLDAADLITEIAAETQSEPGE